MVGWWADGGVVELRVWWWGLWWGGGADGRLVELTVGW